MENSSTTGMDLERFAQLFRILQQRSGLSQKKMGKIIADDAEGSQPAISRALSGKSRPTYAGLRSMVAAMRTKCTITNSEEGVLFTLAGYPHPPHLEAAVAWFDEFINQNNYMPRHQTYYAEPEEDHTLKVRKYEQQIQRPQPPETDSLQAVNLQQIPRLLPHSIPQRERIF
jgi:hypothetical protein